MNFSKKFPGNSKAGKLYKKLFPLIFSAIFCPGLSAQISPSMMKEYLTENINQNSTVKKYQEEILHFYNLRKYQTAWVTTRDSANLYALLSHLQLSAEWGLNENDYEFEFINEFKNNSNQLNSITDSLKADVHFTVAALHLFNDLAFGNTVPILGYTKFNYEPACTDIPEILLEFLQTHQLTFLRSGLHSITPEVQLLQDKIKWIISNTSKPDFKELQIVSLKSDYSNQPLFQKLLLFGIIDSANESIPMTKLKEKTERLQAMFNFPATGILQKELIRELNISVKVRLQQLSLALNYYRWLSCLTQNQSVIVVNIPAANLKVYKKGEVIMEMKMVVGKPATPTYPLMSVINEVIVYPYWYVPSSIATKELLPAIKRNTSYLENNNYQVLDKNGKIVDPYSINWRALSRSNFPYIIRQGTGCDNALGLLKLNFYNPFGAYLHDTPDKKLFSMQKRFFSHGCMRMEKPVELAHLILPNNKIAIDTITEKGCLKSQAPVIIPAEIKMPVVVWYNPIGVNSDGLVIFYEDIYKKFRWKGM